jgi:hypothetical protein
VRVLGLQGGRNSSEHNREINTRLDIQSLSRSVDFLSRYQKALSFCSADVFVEVWNAPAKGHSALSAQPQLTVLASLQHPDTSKRASDGSNSDSHIRLLVLPDLGSSSKGNRRIFVNGLLLLVLYIYGSVVGFVPDIALSAPKVNKPV